MERFLKSKGIRYCKISALQIKRSLGMIRGKDDKVDAVRIAEYGWLRRDQLVACEMPEENLMELMLHNNCCVCLIKSGCILCNPV